MSKSHLRVLRTYRMGVMHDGPDVALFTHPGALTKLALWVAAAVAEQLRGRGSGSGGAENDPNLPLVLAAHNERRGCYVVVGTGGGGAIRVGDSGRARKKREEREKRREEKARQKEERKRARKEARRRKADEDTDDEEEDDEAEGMSEPETETESESSSDDDESDAGSVGARGVVKLNRFGLAFQAVIEATGARVRIDSFEHCVVEVRKDDFGVFLEALSSRNCVG